MNNIASEVLMIVSLLFTSLLQAKEIQMYRNTKDLKNFSAMPGEQQRALWARQYSR